MYNVYKNLFCVFAEVELQNRRITEWLRLEGALGGHLQSHL